MSTEDNTTTEAMTPITITFDMNRLAEHMFPNYEYTGDPEQEPPEPFANAANAVTQAMVHKLLPDIQRAVTAGVTERINEQADEMVGAIIAKAINEGFQKTNHFGEATSERTTLKELIVKTAQDRLEMKVDHRGQRSNGYDRGTTTTWLQYLINDGVESALRGKLQETIEEATKGVQEKVQTITSRVIAEQIVSSLG